MTLLRSTFSLHAVLAATLALSAQSSVAQMRLSPELNRPPATLSVPSAPANRRAEPRPIARIVAIVNTEVLTSAELDQRIRSISRQMEAQNMALPEPAVLERQVLERMILERVQLQAAREAGLRVDDVQLDRAIARIAEQNQMSVQQFRDRVEQDGTPFVRVREEIREDILLTRLREREVDNRVQVTEPEIDDYLAARASGPGETQEVNLGHILLRVPEEATPEQIEQQRVRAEQLLREVSAGGDFSRLAASNSDAAEALAGGELGWRATERLPQLFLDAVSNLAVGGTSPVVRSPAGFHILKVLGRRGAEAGAAGEPVRQTRVRHILMRVTEAAPSQLVRQRLQEIRDRIVNKTTTFADMARQYSADGSAARGGDLGSILPGDTVPQFEQAMDALAPGEVSQPVESPFGWHLIEVIERRTADLPQDRQRLMARQAIRERKIEEAYQEWVRQTRDRAYVDIRLEAR